MRKIVCLATSPWYPIPTRKQQVMSRIPDAEILYFDPSVTYLAPLKDKAARPGLSNYKKEGVHPQENITVYSLPPVLPFFYKFRWINKLNQRRMARFVRRKMREHGFTDAVLWVYSPVTADLVDLVPHKGLVWLSLPREAARHAVDAPQNRRLLRRLRYTYIPEEFFFQNAFEGTPWAEKITGNALRFSIWDEPERGTPALLDERDLPAIDASGCVFCRKVNAGTALYETLERRWLCDA